MQFYEKLSKLRKANNLSQEQLAEKLNVTRQAVSKWESGESYPDMAKIIQLCKILNCSLNELMDDGVMGEIEPNEKENEKEEKKNYFNDFLDYVTKTYNMFIHMSFKSKIVLLLEMCFIALVLLGIGALFYVGIGVLVDLFVSILPSIIGYPLRRILEAISMGVLLVLGVIVFLHLFKIRYLDYYVTITDNNVNTQNVEEPIKENKQESELTVNKNPKIIIRDPAHSSSRFFKGLANIMIFLIKCTVVIIVIPVILAFVFGVGVAVFCLIQGGKIFYWIALCILGVLLLAYIIIHYAYNFLFKLKQPYRIFLWVLISGLLIIGVGGGFTANSIMSLEEDYTPVKTTVYTDKLMLDENEKLDLEYSKVQYELDDSIEGIEVEINHPINTKMYKHWYYTGDDEIVHSYHVYMDDLKTLNLAIQDLKLGKIKPEYYGYGYDNLDIHIRCSKETYEKHIINGDNSIIENIEKAEA
ncbi:MAG: helix-turn-helix domain-containing protein [Erysipelotrichaceae bacterium]